MKILHVFKTYLPDTFGGVEQVINVLADGASALGHTVSVLTTTDTGQRQGPVCVGQHQVVQTKRNLDLMSTPMSIEMLGRYRAIVRDYDLIHYHFPWPFMDLAQIIAPGDIPYVVTYHSDIVKQKSVLRFYKPLMNWFLNNAECVVATSDNYIKTSPVLKELTTSVKVVPLGIPAPAPLADQTDKIGARVRAIATAEQPYFLFVGVLRYYKGLEFAVRAAARTGSRLVIAGAGPEREALETLARDVGATGVEFAGRVTDEEKALLLQGCQGFVFPSHLRSEAFGVSLLEASAYGKPMICAEIGTGTSFVNQHDVTGLVVPPADVTALSQAMSVLENEPEKAAQYGLNARTRFQTLFTSQQMTQGYIDIYERAVAAR